MWNIFVKKNMKKTAIVSVALSICLLVSGITMFAQPVIVNTMTPFPVGTSFNIYKPTATVLPGAGGAGVTWDISGLTPGTALGVATMVSPSSSPYFSTFPTATLCAEITPAG